MGDCINILEHNLVPKFRILSDGDKAEMLAKFKITESNLPKIFDSDPVVKTIEAKAGDVLEIIRESEVAGETTYYRYVVEAV